METSNTDFLRTQVLDEYDLGARVIANELPLLLKSVVITRLLLSLNAASTEPDRLARPAFLRYVVQKEPRRTGRGWKCRKYE